MTNDGLYNYVYDAEGRQTSAAGVTYTYDGDGQRVKKHALSGVEGSNGKLYWFGLGGTVLAETDLSGNKPTEHICFGGQRVARSHGTGFVPWAFCADACKNPRHKEHAVATGRDGRLRTG